MTDPAQAVAPNTPPSTPSSDPGKSPLDVLDQILKDAQGKAKNAVEEKAAEDKKAAEEVRQRQREADAQKVKEELQNIEKVKETPQYQAMIDQRNEEFEKKKDYEEKMDGMEIYQLKRDKQ
jgi:hypothetical protein